MFLKPPVSVNDHIAGSEYAPVELVEYGDYQCPYCGQAYPIVKQIQEELGDELKFVFRNFPLAELHPQAKMAAVAAEAAARQGKFWSMHDIIFENQHNLLDTDLVRYAKTLGLDLAKFKDDINDPALMDKVESDFESGVRSGVNGTPTFFINGHKYNESWEKDILLGHLRSKKILS